MVLAEAKACSLTASFGFAGVRNSLFTAGDGVGLKFRRHCWWCDPVENISFTQAWAICSH